MKILMFCSNPINGGTARVFYELVISMRKLAGKKHEITACINIDNTVEIYKKIEGIVRLPVYPEEAICRGMYGGAKYRRVMTYFLRKIKYFKVKRYNIAKMKKYLLENEIDCLIVHNGGYVGDDLCNQILSAANQIKENVPKRICVFHNDMKKGLLSKIRFWQYDKLISKEATKVVTVSNFTKERLKKNSFISKDIQVIYNGISVKNKLSEEEKKSKISLDESKQNILMIGNFQDNKGQYQFIETAKRLYKKNKDYRFAIIGNVYDKSYYNRCLELLKRLSLNDYFTIYQGINNASEYIDMFDVLVYPSMYDESFGLISLEAMACGKPIVAFACGGIPEVVIDGRNGFLVPVGDVQQLAEKIDWLEKHNIERGKMEILCREDYFNKYMPEKMAKQYFDLIKNEGN